MEAVPLRILITTFTLTSQPCFQYSRTFNTQAHSAESIYISVHLHGNEWKWKRVRQKQDLTFVHRLEEKRNGSKVEKLPA